MLYASKLWEHGISQILENFTTRTSQYKEKLEENFSKLFQYFKALDLISICICNSNWCYLRNQVWR